LSDKRKVCVVTGSRAEYGLLYWLLKEIQLTDNLGLQIVVTGMHLSQEFGLTYKVIKDDGFDIDCKVEMLVSTDTGVGVGKSMGLGMIGFSDAFDRLRPDLLLVLGDRFEIFTAASVATVLRIPIAHIHGGETTEGAYDESFRHSISKMSHLHFTATDAYCKRVIQLGENPERVYNVGAIGIDNIKKISLLSRSSFEKSIDFKLGKKNFLITYHPVTLEDRSSEECFGELLSVLDGLRDACFIFTKANADGGGRVINQMIDEFVEKHVNNSVAFVSLGQLRYLSAIQFMDGVIGNSSSGLIEVPCFNVGTINIGDRQKGRIRGESVIDCVPEKESIRKALDKLYSKGFQKKLEFSVNPYGSGGASKKIAKIINDCSLEGVLKKGFNDLVC